MPSTRQSHLNNSSYSPTFNKQSRISHLNNYDKPKSPLTVELRDQDSSMVSQVPLSNAFQIKESRTTTNNKTQITFTKGKAIKTSSSSANLNHSAISKKQYSTTQKLSGISKLNTSQI
jgi:hypothetical protein